MQVLYVHGSPFLSKLPLWRSTHQKAQSKEHTHSQWLSSPSTVPLWNVPLCSRTKVIMSLFCWYLGRMRSISLWAKNQHVPSLFCHQCRDVGGSRDEPDVNQKIFSSAKETRFRHYQLWPSATLSPRTMNHYGAQRGLNRLTDRWTWKDVCVFLCVQNNGELLHYLTNGKQWIMDLIFPERKNKGESSLRLKIKHRLRFASRSEPSPQATSGQMLS